MLEEVKDNASKHERHLQVMMDKIEDKLTLAQSDFIKVKNEAMTKVLGAHEKTQKLETLQRQSDAKILQLRTDFSVLDDKIQNKLNLNELAKFHELIKKIPTLEQFRQQKIEIADKIQDNEDLIHQVRMEIQRHNDTVRRQD
jgi:hypothetical protein